MDLKMKEEDYRKIAERYGLTLVRTVLRKPWQVSDSVECGLASSPDGRQFIIGPSGAIYIPDSHTETPLSFLEHADLQRVDSPGYSTIDDNVAGAEERRRGLSRKNPRQEVFTDFGKPFLEVLAENYSIKKHREYVEEEGRTAKGISHRNTRTADVKLPFLKTPLFRLEREGTLGDMIETFNNYLTATGQAQYSLRLEEQRTGEQSIVVMEEGRVVGEVPVGYFISKHQPDAWKTKRDRPVQMKQEAYKVKHLWELMSSKGMNLKKNVRARVSYGS